MRAVLPTVAYQNSTDRSINEKILDERMNMTKPNEKLVTM